MEYRIYVFKKCMKTNFIDSKNNAIRLIEIRYSIHMHFHKI